MGNDFNKPLIPQVTDQAANKPPNKLLELMQQNSKLGDIPAAGGVGQDSAREAYAKAQQDAKKQRDEGFRGRQVLPGEMSFEDFLSGYNNKLSGPQTLPVAGGIGGLGGTGEVDMPIAGGNNNVGGILTVEPQLPGFRDDTSTKDNSFISQPFFPDSNGDGVDDRLSDEEKQKALNPIGGGKLEKAEYYTGKDYGPKRGMAYAAVMPQRGMRFVYDQNGRRYSVPIEGYEGPIGNPIKSLNQSLAALSSGGIARMLGE
jgi:hypothetical protein